MKFGDIIKCPSCSNTVAEENVIIKRANLHVESDKIEDYFAGDEEKLCRKVDNIFIKAYCPTCKKNFEVMVLVDVKPTKCYSADSRSDLVMIDKE